MPGHHGHGRVLGSRHRHAQFQGGRAHPAGKNAPVTLKSLHRAVALEDVQASWAAADAQLGNTVTQDKVVTWDIRPASLGVAVLGRQGLIAG